MKVSNKMIQEIWNEHAGEYNVAHNVSEDANRKEWKNILKRYIGENIAQKVLDIGTGTGFLAFVAEELGYRCTGVDLAPKMIDVAKAFAKKNGFETEFQTADWSNLPFQDESYEAVINRCIVWTLFTPEKTLNEWKRVLKPQGKLLCFCPESSLEGKIQPDHYEKEVEEQLPLKNASPEQLCKVLTDCGYSEVEIFELRELGKDDIFGGWYLLKGVKQ